MQPGRLRTYATSIHSKSVLLDIMFAWLTVSQQWLKLHLMSLHAGTAYALKTEN